MTDVEKIYIELYDNDIDVINIKFGKIKAVSICNEDSSCSIVVDENKFDTIAELKTVLLHEQGHCETGAFYNQYTKCDLISRHEYRADKYVADNKITKHDIDKAHKEYGYTEVWEFAEYFGITVDYMKRLFNIIFGK